MCMCLSFDNLRSVCLPTLVGRALVEIVEIDLEAVGHWCKKIFVAPALGSVAHWRSFAGCFLLPCFSFVVCCPGESRARLTVAVDQNSASGCTDAVHGEDRCTLSNIFLSRKCEFLDQQHSAAPSHWVQLAYQRCWLMSVKGTSSLMTWLREMHSLPLLELLYRHCWSCVSL